MSGLTETGFSRPIQTEIADQILADERGTISGQLTGTEDTVLGNLNQIFADQLAQAWEVLEEAVNGLDPENATGSRLVALALLTGVKRRPAQKGLASCTLVLAASKTFAAGDLAAHVLDEPSSRWLNRDEVVSTTAGTYTGIVFEAEDTGPDFSAAAGTLTVIASPVTGWTSITNPTDATPGSEEETIENLRLRRESSLAASGGGTVAAITADVSAVDGVLQCTVEENTTDATVNTITPHSFRAVIWDGSPAAADDDEVAQAIYDTRPAGIASVGGESGTAVTADGQLVTMAFERATEVPI